MHKVSLEESLMLEQADAKAKFQLWVSDTPQGTDINPAAVLDYPDRYQLTGFKGLRSFRVTADLENPLVEAELDLELKRRDTTVTGLSLSPYMTGGALVNGRALFDPGRYVALYAKVFAPGVVIREPVVTRPVPGFQGMGPTVSGVGAISPAWPAGHQLGDIGLLFAETDNENLGTIPTGWAHVTGSPVGVTSTVGGVAPTVEGVSGISASAGGNTVFWPSGHQANDIGLLIVESANEAVTLSTPAGFVEVTGSPQGTGTAGGTTATRVTAFWCRATSSAQTNPFVADPGDHFAAYLLVIRGCVTTGNPWDVTAGNTGTSSTSFTIPGFTTTVAETLVIAIVANAFASTSPQGSAFANASLANLTTRGNDNTGSGNGGGLTILSGTKATAGVVSATTGTLANASVQGRLALAFKPVSASAGTAKTMLSLLWKRATSNTEPALSIGDSGDHQLAKIFNFRGCIASGNPWDVVATGSQTAETTLVSLPGVTTTVANTLVVQAVTNTTDVLNGQARSFLNAGLTLLVPLVNTNTTAGTGGGLTVVLGTKFTAGVLSATTAALEEPSVQARITIALKPPSPSGGGPEEIFEGDLPWRPIFVGRIDAADPAAEEGTLKLRCRDISCDIMDRQIEPGTTTYEHRIQENTAEDVIRDLIELGFPGLTWATINPSLTVAGVHTILVPRYSQQPMSTLLAMLEVARLDGSDLRGRWGGYVDAGTASEGRYNDDEWFLTYYLPDRLLAGTITDIGPTRYFTLGGLNKSRDEVRNRVRVVPADPPRTPSVADNVTSQTNYGLLFLGIVEDAASRIVNTAQADALALAILSDTKEPKVMAVVTAPFQPWVEINDVYKLLANAYHHDTDMTLAVSGYEHVMTEDGEVTTTLNTRDLPAAANAAWRKGEQKTEYASTVRPTGTAPEGAKWVVTA